MKKAKKEVAKEMKIKLLKIKDIEFNPFQCRTKKSYIALEQLAESIRIVGVKVPISVYKNKSGKFGKRKYVLESGERRITASEMAGKKKIKSIIFGSKPTESQLKINSIIENCLREDLCPVDKARGLRELIFLIPNCRKNHDTARMLVRRLGNIEDRGGMKEYLKPKKYGRGGKPSKANRFTTIQDVLETKKYLDMVGMSRNAADQYLSFLELPEEIQKKIIYSRQAGGLKKRKARGFLTIEEAGELARIKNPLIQKQVCEKYIHSNLGRPGLNALVNTYIENAFAAKRELFYARKKTRSPADYRLGQITRDCFKFSSTLNAWRLYNLVKLVGIFEKREFLLGLTDLRNVTVKLQKTIEERIFDTIQLLKQKQKEEEELRRMDFRVRIGADSRNKHMNRFVLPQKAVKSFKPRPGDIFRMRIYGIIRQEDGVKFVQEGNKFKLDKFVEKSIWASVNQSAKYYGGYYENGWWIIPEENVKEFKKYNEDKILLRGSSNEK